MAADSPQQPADSAQHSALPRVAAVVGTMLWTLLATILSRGWTTGGALTTAITLPPLAITARFLLASRLTRLDARLAVVVAVLGCIWCTLLCLMPVPYAPLGLYLLLSLKGWGVLAPALAGTYAFWRAGTMVRSHLADQPTAPA